MAENLVRAAKEARKQWSAELTKREADEITECMREADLVAPEFNGDLAKHTVYYASLALGLLDELFGHIRDSNKRGHLESVELALRELCNHFDRELNHFPIYEHASRAVSIWLECLNG